MKRFISILIAVLMTLFGVVPAYAGSQVTLDIKKDNITHPVSQMMYGISLDNKSIACDGGLGANLVSNNSFEFDDNREADWIFSDLSVGVQKADPLNQNNIHYAKITVDGQGYATNLGYTELLKNDEYDEALASKADMGFRAEETYDFSCYLKNVDFDGTVSIYLDSKSNDDNAVQLSTNNLSSKVWKKFSANLKSAADEDGGLVIVFKGKGTLYMDYVSLVPKSSYGYGQEQWKHTALRSDLVTAISDLHPSFIRFGSVEGGKSVDNLSSWKDSIGALEQRIQKKADWQSDERICTENTSSVGYHEYFQLCEELNAKAIPVVSAGMICQEGDYELMSEAYDKLYMTDEQYDTYLENEKGFNAGDKSAMQERAESIDSLGIRSAGDWDKYIQNIALTPNTDEFSNYAQDILDLIEYANADANTSYWGALRSANGHTEPFNLEYIAIGDGNWGDIYFRNFKALKQIIHEKYPDIKIICSAGNSFDGEQLDQSWSNIGSDKTDVLVDEHYFTDQERMLQNSSKYDSYDRAGAGVMVGKFSSCSTGNANDLFSAVEESAFMTGLERNGDIVKMNAYSPTLLKIHSSKDSSGLIRFDSQDMVLTPNYYSRLLFANNYGKEYVDSSFSGSDNEDLYQSVSVDMESETLYVKIVNAGASKERITLNISGFDQVNYVSSLKISGGKTSANDIGGQKIAPVEHVIESENNSFEYKADGYSVSVIRIAFGNNSGKAFYTIPDTINLETKSSGNFGIGTFLAVVIGIFIIGSAAGYLIYTRLVLKKQGRNYKLKRKKNDSEE